MKMGKEDRSQATYDEHQTTNVPRDGRLHLFVRRGVDELGDVLFGREERIVAADRHPSMRLWRGKVSPSHQRKGGSAVDRRSGP